MNQEGLFQLAQQNYLFEHLTHEEILEVLSLSKEMEVPQNHSVLEEGRVENEVYLILSGKVEVAINNQPIATLHSGEVIGEMALIDQSPRSASIKTLEETKLLQLPLALLSRSEKSKPLYMKIVKNISKQLALRLRKTNDLTVKSLESELRRAKAHIELGRFLFLVLVTLSAWIFTSSVAARYSNKLSNTGVISSPVIFFLFLAAAVQVKKSAYPPGFYGLTLKNWKKDAWEGVLFSLPVLIAAVWVKYLVIWYLPSFHQTTLFFFETAHPKQLILPIAYVLLTPLQEFLARGTVQSCTKSALPGSHTTFWAIFLASLIFASFHAFISAQFALVALVFGLFWGWMYDRQGSLVGCSVSHALIGGWCLVFLGLHVILR